MRYTVVALSAVFVMPVTGAAQEAGREITQASGPTYKYAVKVYNAISYQRTSTSVFSPGGITKSHSRKEEINYLHPSIAFAWQTKRKNMIEVELSSFTLRRKKDVVYSYDSMGQNNGVIAGASMVSSDISVRIERIVNFDKRGVARLRPMLGLGLNPYYKLDKVVPSTTAARPATEQHLGVRCYVTPRLNYDISKRLLLDVNIPVLVADLDLHKRRQYTPTVNRDETSSVTDFNMFPRNFALRVGFGLKL